MKMSVEVVLDSVSHSGDRITTFVLTYPRIIHAELLTHSMLKRNSASSRAIPVALVNKEVKNNPAKPVRWGANKSGMQDGGAIDVPVLGMSADEAWSQAAEDAVFWSNSFAEAGYHKQVCNRLTEPFQWMRVVITGTEWSNFLWLRDDEEADPTISMLASMVREELERSVPAQLNVGEWHLPFVGVGRENGRQIFVSNGSVVTLEQAKNISLSCCAQVSFKKCDDSLEKAERVVERLFTGRKVHASPAEHQARVMGDQQGGWEDGVTHMDRDGSFWSSNLKGWVQLRQTLPNNYKGDRNA